MRGEQPLIQESSAPATYVQLAFLIERHFPGYIDAYYGPPELRAEAMSGETPSLESLRDMVASLTRTVMTDPALPTDRRAFLEEELLAMRTTIEILSGNEPAIVDEVELLYGVRPAWVDESIFAEAQAILDDILPGSEPLCERVLAFRDRSRMPVEVAASIMPEMIACLRRRTRGLYDLPADDECQISFVADKPWRAYNWYLGQGKSLIEINRDAPLEAWDALNTSAHETYPGHHTERTVKEYKLYIAQDRLEHSIALNNTPSALISEGIATNALSAVASEAEVDAMLIECYERAGLHRSDAVRARAFAAAYDQLESVADNQMLLMYGDHATDDEVINYGMRYALTTRDDEELTLRFLKDPLSRSYRCNYTLGRRLVAAFLDRATDRTQAFWRLLSEPLTSRQLRRLTEEQS